jgi:hypothetical protein
MNDLAGIAAEGWTLNGTPDVVATPYNRGMDFDMATPEYLDTVNSPAFDTPDGITIVAVVRATALGEGAPGLRCIVCRDDLGGGNRNWYLAYDVANNAMTFAIFDGGVQRPDNAALAQATLEDSWYFWVAQYDGSFLIQRYAAIGDAITTPAATAYVGNIDTDQVQIRLGAFGDASRPWNGIINDVIIWNRSLSLPEVQGVYDLYRGAA